jgi:hypothetical protein
LKEFSKTKEEHNSTGSSPSLATRRSLSSDAVSLERHNPPLIYPSPEIRPIPRSFVRLPKLPINFKTITVIATAKPSRSVTHHRTKEKEKQRGALSLFSFPILPAPPRSSMSRRLPPSSQPHRAPPLASRFGLARKEAMRTNRCRGVAQTLTLPHSAPAAGIQRNYQRWRRGVCQLAPSHLHVPATR